MKREAESLIVAAQNQSIRTNLVKAKIDKSQGDFLCRMCKKVVVAVNLHSRNITEVLITLEK